MEEQKEDKLDQIYRLVQKNGVQLEQLASDIKAVAEGHQVIRNEMRGGFEAVNEKIDLVDGKVNYLGMKVEEINKKVDKLDQKLDVHMRQPAHA